MILTFGRLLADVWALFRREADLIVRVAGPTIVLPALALLLFTDPLPPWPGTGADEAAMARWFTAFEAWGNANALWYAIAAIVSLYGQATLAMLLLDPARPTVGQAMRGAAIRMPRFLLAGALVNLATGLGFLALILPGMILFARLVTVIPVVAREREGAVAAFGRSLGLTRGATVPILGAVLSLFVIQWLALLPLAPLARQVSAPGADDGIVAFIVDAGVAAIDAGHSVALLLLGVVLYRRFASTGT